MTERTGAPATLAAFLAIAATSGCRSEAPAPRPAATSAASAPQHERDENDPDEEYRPPEWRRVAPDPEEEGDELPPVATADDSEDAIYNDVQDSVHLHGPAGADAPGMAWVVRVRDDATDSPESLVARYPFLPIRAHGLPAVSADGKAVAVIAAPPSTIGHGSEFALDLYDVEHDRRRVHLILWSYAEEDAREDLNDSLGSAQATAKRMDGRMSQANALLRATSRYWQPLGKLPHERSPDDDDEEDFSGIGLLLTVAKGKAHVTNLHFPALRAP